MLYNTVRDTEVDVLGLVFTAVVTVLIAIMKGALSILGFFFRIVTGLLRLIACVVPVSALALIAAAVIIACRAFTGADLLPETFFFHPNAAPFVTSLGALIFMVRDLRAENPPVASAIILAAAVILAIPVFAILLIAHTFVAIIPLMPWLIACDAVVYIVFGILSRQTPFKQITSRYYFLFPKRARRRDERNYEAWLRRHSDEFRDDTYGIGGMRRSGYDYEDDEYDDRRDTERSGRRGFGYRIDDDYDDEYDRRQRVDDRREERRRRRQKRIDEYYDDDEYDDGYTDSRREYRDSFREFFNENERERIRDHKNDDRSGHDDHPSSRSGNGFDFFAGCNSLESVEKKYRSLAKIYHPDNQDGDTSAIQEINASYEQAKRRFR